MRDEPLRLTRREFDLLELLMESPRRVVSRNELLAQVWDGQEVRDHVLDVHLSRLRSKVTAAGGPHIAEAVPGVGYRIGRSRCERCPWAAECADLLPHDGRAQDRSAC